jgi:hypothetical protein
MHAQQKTGSNQLYKTHNLRLSDIFLSKRPKMPVTSLSQLHPATLSETRGSTERIGLVVAAGAAAGCMDLVWGLQRLIHEWYHHTHIVAAIPAHVLRAHYAASSRTAVMQYCRS